MSFLLRTLPRNTTPLSRPLSTRLFTTSPSIQKSATDSAKETFESVNRTVSDAAVKGMEKGGMSLFSSTVPSFLRTKHTSTVISMKSN